MKTGSYIESKFESLINSFKEYYFANTVTLMFVMLSLSHFFMWSIIPALGFSSPPLDVVENLIWGREWLIGTHKHPPLQAWLTEIAWNIGKIPAVYVMSQVCIAVTATVLFWFGSALNNRVTGFIAAAIFYLTPFATIASPELNANIVSMPFWALSGYFFWQLLKNEYQFTKTYYWLIFAISIALTFYSKYSSVFLLIGLFTAAIFFSRDYSIFHKPKFLMAVGFTIFLCLPNLSWLIANDFQPFYYSIARSEVLDGVTRIINPVKFLVGVSLNFALPLLALFLTGGRFYASYLSKSNNLFIHFLAFTPILSMVVFALIGGKGLRTMWAASLTVFIPLVLASHIKFSKMTNLLRFGCVVIVFSSLILPTTFIGYSFYSESTKYPKRTGWDSDTLAKIALMGWNRVFAHPPEIVIGPAWEAGLVAINSTHRPPVMISADHKISPWISIDQVHEKGALVVWTGLDNHYKNLEPFVSRGSIPIWSKGKLIKFQWAVLAPKQKKAEI